MSPLSALEVGGGGAKGGHAELPTRYAALLNGTYVEPEHSNVQGCVRNYSSGCRAAMLAC